MEQLYLSKSEKTNALNPKPETIRFLLDYSRSLKIVEAGGIEIDLMNN